MGHAAFGTFAALNALAALFIVLLDLGVNQFLTKELAADHSLEAEKLATFFSLKILLACIYPVFMMLLGYMLGYSWDKIGLLFLISLGYSFFQLALYLRAKFQALQKFNLDSLASVTDKFFLIVFSLLLLFTTISITSYVSIRFASMLLALLVIAVPAWKLFSKEPFQFKWELNAWKNTLKQTYPFALITILYSIHDKIDQVMIERILGAKASGLYAAAYRWLDAFMMYLWIILPMFFARFSHTRNNPEELNKLLKSAQVVAAVPMIFVAVFVWFHGEHLFVLLTNSTPAEIVEMTYCLKVLFIAVFIHAYLAVFGTLLTAIGGEIFLNRMMLFTIALNIGLNLYFIPAFGIAGAAWATSISTLFLSVAYIFKLFQSRLYKIDLLMLLKLGIYGLLLFCSFYICSLFALNWMISSFAGAILMAFFVFSSGLYKLLLKY